MKKRLMSFQLIFLSCRTGHKRIGRDPLMNLPDREPAVLRLLPFSVPRLETLLQLLAFVH